MPRRLADLLEERLGTKAVPFFNRLGVASIGVTAVRVFSSDPNRFEWTFVNLSTNGIYLMADNLVTATRGIFCGPSGGGTTMIWEEDFELVSSEWWAIATGAASSYLAFEIVSAGA